MAVFLIRHGETVWNAQRIMQRADTPLSERGQLQARCVAERVAREGAISVLSSDLARARDTAAPIAAAAHAAHTLWPTLRERDFGALQGLPYDELPEHTFEPAFVPPGGESVGIFETRIATAFEALVAHAREQRGNTVIVTHALVCRLLLERFLDTGSADADKTRLPNCSFTAFEPAAPYRVLILASTSHLSAAAQPDERPHPAGI